MDGVGRDDVLEDELDSDFVVVVVIVVVGEYKVEVGVSKAVDEGVAEVGTSVLDAAIIVVVSM
jgi:hypothetical protein